jgi:hypothetical protein
LRPEQLLLAPWQERRHSELGPLRQPEAVRPGGPMEWLAVWLVRSSSCPQQAGSSAVCRRAAAGPSSGFRQAVWLPAAAQAGSAEQALWSAPVVAWRPLAAAGMLPARELAPPSERQAGEAGSAKAEVLVQPAASARRALSLRVEAAAVVCVQVAQPREAAAESGARGRPPEVAVAASGAAAEPQQEAVAAEPGAELQPGEAAAEAARAVAPRQVGAAEPVRDAEVQRPAAEVAAPRVPWARRLAAVRLALASSVCRPGPTLPWPGPRRAVRTAHAMWRSRAALPSKPLWQAARCEGLS